MRILSTQCTWILWPNLLSVTLLYILGGSDAVGFLLLASALASLIVLSYWYLVWKLKCGWLWYMASCKSTHSKCGKCAKCHHFYNMWVVLLQICNGTEWCGISFNHFLFFFSLLSLHFSSSDITSLHSFLLSLFFLLNLIVFLSDITLSFFFSPFSSFTPISVVVVLFFIFLQWFDTRFGNGWVEMVIGESLVVGCDGQIQWWVGRLVMGESVVVGSIVRNRWMGSE